MPQHTPDEDDAAAREYLVVVADTAGRFRDAYGPYPFAAARREADRRRRELTAAGAPAAVVRLARHHPTTIPVRIPGPRTPDATET